MPRFRLDQHLPPDFFINKLRAEARAGLTASPKYISSKWLFDAKGSQLFKQITQQPEYYPFRVERGILEAVADEIAAVTRASSIIEFGAGFSDKTDILLSALRRAGTLRTYVPIDISESALVAAGSRLIADYPDVSVRAVFADFETQSEIPAMDESPAPRLVLFLGSSISQLSPDQRAKFLRKLWGSLRQDDMLLLGVDLVKDPARLMVAYNDSAGVSTTFNKNLLSVLNAGVGADFNLDAFDYIVTWDSEVERLAMWQQSRVSQVVHLSDIDLPVDLAAGERIRTCISTKFRRAGIQAELESAGFFPCHWWTDPHEECALFLSRLM